MFNVKIPKPGFKLTLILVNNYCFMIELNQDTVLFTDWNIDP